MEHEEIIAMAREEGLSFVPDANSPLVRIVRKAVAKEREAIAAHYAAQPHVEFFGAELAEEIRARGQKEGV